MRITPRLLITILIISLVLSSCSSRHVQQSGGTPEHIYNTAFSEPKLNGKISMLPGADRSDLPYIPIIKPSEIARIWIYDHITPTGDLVVGHWIYIKLKPERWYIEDDSEKPVKTFTKIPLPPDGAVGGGDGGAQKTLLPQQ